MWGLEARRLRQELADLGEARDRSAPATGPWVVQGILRAVLADRGAVLITHEAIPGVMPAMTMGFEVEGSAVVRDLQPGDAVWFTVRVKGDRLALTAIERRAPGPAAAPGN